jgi:hypothetical protein
LVHPFKQVFETVEPALPEPGHLACPVDQRGQGAKLRAIMRQAAFVTVAHQPGSSGQSPDGLFSIAAQSFEKGPTSGIGQRPEKRIAGVRNLQSITLWLLIDI